MNTELTLSEIEAFSSVLVIEDNEDVAYLLVLILQREGFAVRTLTNGRDASDFIAESSPPDIIVMDLMLPYVDGFELINQVRENFLWRDVPIVVLSGKVAKRDIVRAFELGADDYVTKPFQPKELTARVRQFVRHRG